MRRSHSSNHCRPTSPGYLGMILRHMAPTELSSVIRSSSGDASDRRRATRSILAETWPLLEPHLEQAIDDVARRARRTCPASARSSRRTPRLDQNTGSGAFPGPAGRQSRRSLCRIVPAHGREGSRAWGSTPGSAAPPAAIVVQMSLDVLARKHRFSPAKLADRGKTIVASHQLRRVERDDAASASRRTGGAAQDAAPSMRQSPISTAPSAR